MKTRHFIFDAKYAPPTAQATRLARYPPLTAKDTAIVRSRDNVFSQPKANNLCAFAAQISFRTGVFPNGTI